MRWGTKIIWTDSRLLGEVSRKTFLSAHKARYLVTAPTGQTTRRHAGTTSDALSASRWNSNCTTTALFDNHRHETRLVVERLDPVAFSDSLS